MHTNVFIDGTDGTGKTTLIDGLFERLDVECFFTSFQFPSRMPEAHEKRDDFSRTMFHLQDFNQVMRDHRELEDLRLFDRSFISTMAYQGFASGLQVHPRFESVFRLGAEALLTSGHVSDGPRRQIFIHVTAQPEVAAQRVFQRSTDRVYDIEEEGDFFTLVERLVELRKRLDWCYAHTAMHLPNLFPKHEYHFIELDSTQNSPVEILDEAIQKLEAVINPKQGVLFSQ